MGYDEFERQRGAAPDDAGCCGVSQSKAADFAGTPRGRQAALLLAAQIALAAAEPAFMCAALPQQPPSIRARLSLPSPAPACTGLTKSSRSCSRLVQRSWRLASFATA